MTDLQKNKIKEVVLKFATLANISDKVIVDELIEKLISMDINDAIDYILVSLNDLVNRNQLRKEDVLCKLELLLSLNVEKYKTVTDLIDRLSWIKQMNIEHPEIPISENHKLILEAFDKFNELLKLDFDCYYTGGLMGYIATNHELERYHGDLDLFINEEQLPKLKKYVDQSENFEFVSNMDHKDKNGHEYKIIYKETPMNIGLFLFERKIDQSIVTKSYYYQNQDNNQPLFVDEHHFTKKYTDLSFSNQVRENNGRTFRIMSLEHIYNQKKNGRPKDRYDADIIKNNVDMLIEYNIDVEKSNNYSVEHKLIDNYSIVHRIEEIIQTEKIGTQK